MCGISGIFGKGWTAPQLCRMLDVQRHRGPDAEGIYHDPDGLAGLAHNRLSVIDLSPAGRQPLASEDGGLQIILNGEIYNYLELRRELETEFVFRTRTDTEVLLNAYRKWGTGCLDKLIGMFAFVVWDEREKVAFLARDRFGVKPLHYHVAPDGTLFIASEIKALHAAVVERIPDEEAWASYLASGLTDTGRRTFWQDVCSLPAGHFLVWRNNSVRISKWYDLAERVGQEIDSRPDPEVEEEYSALLKECVALRFRADVPVGINLSGGLDSSTLLGLVGSLNGTCSGLTAYTFATGDQRYDETPWVHRMLEHSGHQLEVATLGPEQVPNLALDVQRFADEPYGGIPTLAYAKLFERARAHNTVVLLDGNGMDEQWAGYDYYQQKDRSSASVVQGTSESPVKADCLTPQFGSMAKDLDVPNAFDDKLRNLQLRDVKMTKIPRAMRFNDSISMRSSTELREPFLDHRLFEIAFRQPERRKLENGQGKMMIRKIAAKLVPAGLNLAPKRPLQTPQREWLRGELVHWADEHINSALESFGGAWLDPRSVRREWARFREGGSDNSFYIWQWISLALIERTATVATASVRD